MATKEYDKNNTTRINLKLNNKTDADIIEKLDAVENVQGYIKAIIRNQMEGATEMKKFEKVTEEIYGARKAGYTFDLAADRELNTQMMRVLIAERGERFVDDELDSFYDGDGDLYMDEDGQPYAVCMVYDGNHYVPLCWQKLRKAQYKIKPEHLDKWGSEATEETIIDGDTIKKLADDWEMSFDDVWSQLTLIK